MVCTCLIELHVLHWDVTLFLLTGKLLQFCNCVHFSQLLPPLHAESCVLVIDSHRPLDLQNVDEETKQVQIQFLDVSCTFPRCLTCF